MYAPSPNTSGASSGHTPADSGAANLSAFGGSNTPDTGKSSTLHPRVRRRNRLITSCLECRRRCVRAFGVDRALCEIFADFQFACCAESSSATSKHHVPIVRASSAIACIWRPLQIRTASRSWQISRRRWVNSRRLWSGK